ncbi:TetR/AcrR family transcriptional regulator [Antrihabitans sp. YC2-6]|uniref:TetR/AcrR family transcriptional regulator n=1 Tax=Antrihabitans sp. YC2-6 TaxID=2799498 RepID=UPI0018F7C0F7|nr:TetR/AcrR family transcriptional regulator [Antrihabitans sp. YC2-6]MBJ8344406.1 TetR/AcrR family transcriptional regulator [Antrihabitans sp. YC2-6]
MSERQQRVDAYASASRIVVAARDLFSEHGASVTLSEIARRAGVGPATLYRHFPNRQALAEAVYEAVFVADIEPLLAKFENSVAPRAELLDVCERLVKLLQRQQGLISSLNNLTDFTHTLLDRHYDAFARAVHQAQAAGNLRRDIGARDVTNVLALVTTAFTAVNLDRTTQRRYLSLMLDGLDPAHASPLPP